MGFKCLFVLFVLFSFFTEIRADTVYAEVDKGFYFVMEKIDDKTEWQSYVNEAQKKNSRIAKNLAQYEYYLDPQTPKEERIALTKRQQSEIYPIVTRVGGTFDAVKKQAEIFSGANDGLENFRKALLNVLEGQMKSDVWVAYVTDEKPSNKYIHTNERDKIEMAFAVLVKEGSPLIMHMGIARNPFHVISNKIQHNRISALLHAFAAATILKKYKSPTHMITTPLSSMANILKGAGLKVSSFAEGMNKDGSWIIQTSYPLDDKFSFTLYDRNINDDNKNLILSMDKNNVKSYWWLFGRLHVSYESHPYFVVALQALADLFKKDLQELLETI